MDHSSTVVFPCVSVIDIYPLLVLCQSDDIGPHLWIDILGGVIHRGVVNPYVNTVNPLLLLQITTRLFLFRVDPQ